MSLSARLRGASAVAVAFLALSACSSGGGDPIELAEVTTGAVTQTVAAPANVEPADRRTVTSPATGTIEEIVVAPGDEVRAGDVILRISSDSLDAAISQARAGLDAASALGAIGPAVDLSGLVSPIREQVQEVVPPVLEDLETRAEQLEDPDLRAELLLRLNDARIRYREVVDELASAESEAEAAARRSTAAQRAAAEAQRRQAQAALDAAQQREDQLTVTSPIDGVVELADGDPASAGAPELPSELGGFLGSGSGGGPVAPGAQVAVGQALFTVYDLSGFHVRATVDEVDAIEVAAGQPVEILVEAYMDRSFRGRVERVGVAPEQGRAGGVVYPVTVRFQDDLDDVTFRVGLTASVEIAVEEVDDAPVVPSRALLVRDGRDVVFVARTEDGGRVVRAVEIELLAVGEERAAVAGDLEVGEEVVVSGFDDLEDGDPLPS